MPSLLEASPSAGQETSWWINPRAWLREQKLSRPFWLFFIAAFFFDVGFGIYFFLFNLYLLDFHYSDRAIGLVNGALTLGALAGTLPTGAVARKIGARPLLVFCFLGAPVIGLLRALWIGESAQIALAFVAGFVMCSWTVCFLPVLTRLTTETNRTSAFSLIFSVSIGTSSLGAVLCGYLSQWLKAIGLVLSPVETKQLILLAACALVTVGLVALLRLRIPPEARGQPSAEDHNPNSSRVRKRFIPPYLLRFLPAMALWSAVLAAFLPFANVYLSRDLQISLAHIGVIFAAAQVIQLCAGLLNPVLFRMLGLVNGIMATELATALMLALLGRARKEALVIGLYFGFSASQWMTSPGLYNLLMNETADRDRSMAAAVVMFSNSLVSSAATAGAGILFTQYGYPPVLLAIAVLALLIALLSRFLIAPYPRTSPVLP